jgi:hydrophobic/amphiphilic exporter-1 (mainly G- bacteria), HAE1 family
MFISTVAIKRPIFASTIIAALLVFGVVAYRSLGVDLMPKIDFPVVSVITQLRGADPETMETRVSDPIEEGISTLSGLKTLRSTSAEGYSVITAEFQLEKNIDVAFQEVQARVNSVRAQLPTDVEDPVIEKMDLDAAPIVTLILSGDLSPRDMYHLADKGIKERLQRVRNVGSVKIVGGQDRKIWLWLDPAKLKQNLLTVQDVRTALQRQHVEIPGGRIETGPVELVTRTKAEFQNVEEMNELILRQQGDEVVRLKDVGFAEDGLEEQRSYSQYQGKPGMALQIRRQSGTNTVQVAHDVKAEIAKLQKELEPRGIRLQLAMDTSIYIEQSLDQVKEHLLVGGGLAVLTVLVFLLNFRSTFICALVLPTSILATFMMLALAGFTLNMMTLMALTLAVGLLIDDSIVVQENISRHVQAGKTARFAADFATREIGLAVLATALSVVAVFLPTALTKGIIGRFFFPFGMTISAAVLVSVFVSFTMDPMLSSRLLKKHGKLNPIFRAFELTFRGMEKVYGKLLGVALKWRWTVLAIAVGLFVGSFAFAKYIKFEFVPTEDRSEFLIAVRSPVGSSLERTREIMEQVRAKLNQFPELDYTFYSIGADQMEKVNEGQVYVKLKGKKERLAAKERSQVVVMNDLRSDLAAIRDAVISVQLFDAVGSSAGMKSQTIQYEMLGTDLKTLDRMAQGLLAKMRAANGYKDLDTSYEAGKPEAAITINRQQAERLGVSPAAVADTVATAIGGMNVAKFKSEGERYDVALRFLESSRNRMELLNDLWVPSIKGPPQELRNFAVPVASEVPVQINRYNRQREIVVYANLEPGKVLGDAQSEVDGFMKGAVPAGYAVEWTGQAQIMTESFGYLLETMILSVIVIYMVLAAQFESVVHPFTIMLSLPLAFVGALLALLIFGQTVSIMTMMAFIFLLGLVTKNAILLIDYANTLRERDGLERDAALRKAGPVRLRPILMTTVAMIFGMIPTALGTGEGSESNAPMAIAIIGGLVSSTLLTLLVVPVVYSLLDPLSEFIRKRVKSEGSGSMKAHEPAAVPAKEVVEEVLV